MSTGYPGRPRVSLYVMGIMTHVVLGALAGAAGTTALNAATYVDMAGRDRLAVRRAAPWVLPAALSSRLCPVWTVVSRARRGAYGGR